CQQPDGGKKVKYDKPATRISLTDLEKKCDQRQQQPGREPAHQDLAHLEPGLRALLKLVIAAAVHAQHVDQACERADSAEWQDLGYATANHHMVADLAHEAGKQDDAGVDRQQEIVN